MNSVCCSARGPFVCSARGLFVCSARGLFVCSARGLVCSARGLVVVALVAGLIGVIAGTGRAQAADPRRDALLAGYGAEARSADPSFAGFSARRGETLFRTRWGGGDARTPACTACHTDDPRAVGRNAKTGRPIDPIAAATHPKRFTDPDEVEKHFVRDCKSVLGRACTPLEKGDYITFMTEPSP